MNDKTKPPVNKIKRQKIHKLQNSKYSIKYITNWRNAQFLLDMFFILFKIIGIMVCPCYVQWFSAKVDFLKMSFISTIVLLFIILRVFVQWY